MKKGRLLAIYNTKKDNRAQNAYTFMAQLFVLNFPLYNVRNLPFPDSSSRFHVHVRNHLTGAVYMPLERDLTFSSSNLIY